MTESLDYIEPDSFRERLISLLSNRPLTPGVLTIKTANALEATVNTEELALRGAGVQMSYEGLRLTRAIIHDEPWTETDRLSEYYLDLLAADVLVSQGFHHLATTGVATQAVDIVQRFGRNQTYEQVSQPENLESSLEIDVIELAVNTGADYAIGTIPPAVSAFGSSFAREISEHPLPEPGAVLGDVGDRLSTVGQSPQPTEVDE